MPSSSKHPPPKVYANCYRTAEGVEPLARYGNNVYHQAEVIYSMLFAALSDKAAPAKIFWRMPLLPWSRGMLDLLRKPPFASATRREDHPTHIRRKTNGHNLRETAVERINQNSSREHFARRSEKVK